MLLVLSALPNHYRVYNFLGRDRRDLQPNLVDTVSGEYHVTEMIVVHDGTSAYATEYGTIFTGTAALATYDVDVSGTDVRLLATPTSTNNTEFKLTRSTINV